MRVLLILISAVVLGGGGTFLWFYYGGFEAERKEAILFIEKYGEYAEIAEQVESLVHLPGTEGNTNRAELLSLLESILTKDMTPEKRDQLARLAYANLDAIKREVDSAQVAQAELYEVLQDLDNISRTFSSIELRTHAVEVVGIARRRAELSARITSVLSETHEETQAIITRILAEDGRLTPEHITIINESTDNAERRFEILEDLYTELIEKKNEADALFVHFIETAI